MQAQDKNDVYVYDSYYPCVSMNIKNQISSFLKTECKLYFVDVQQQLGSCDCGLFAIAFATATVYDVDPSGYCFHQLAMRRQLRKCFIKGKI